MHSLLENYLSEMAEQLRSLPAARRNEELKEMRQHLINAVIVNQEMGQSEEDAAASAVAQCGKPAELTQGLIQAWRRGETLRRRSFWGSAACTFLLPQAFGRLSYVFFTSPLGKIFHAPNHVWWIDAEPYLISFGFCILVGMISGRFFPRRAVAGTILGVSLYLVFDLLRLFYFLYHVSVVDGDAGVLPICIRALPIFILMVIEGSVTVLASFLASRQAGTRQADLARSMG